MRQYLEDVQRIPDAEGHVSLMAFYSQFLKRERAIYCFLNKFRREGSLVYGYCWSSLPKPKFLDLFYTGDGADEA